MTSPSRVSVPARWREILLVEDDSTRAHRHGAPGIAQAKQNTHVTVRLHRIGSTGWKVLAEKTYRVGTLQKRFNGGGKAAVALKLIDGVKVRRDTVVAAGPAFGCTTKFLAGISDRGFDCVVEIRPSARLRREIGRGVGKPATAKRLLRLAAWRKFSLAAPFAAAPLKYWAAQLTDVVLPGGRSGRLFAAQIGRIPGIHRGTIFGLTSERNVELMGLLRVVGWARWIRPAARRQEREVLSAKQDHVKSERRINGASLPVRASISIAREQDKRAAAQMHLPQQDATFRGVLTRSSPILNVAELFAGAGGMGLGFLMANTGITSPRYRLMFSGEVNPIYVETLNNNHDFLRARDGRNGHGYVPPRAEAIDLRDSAALSLIRRQTREFGKVHVLIGGPPCQGFSNANRNSWHSANPNNQLVDVFLSYVESLRPRVFLLENVQGILWTPKAGRSTQRMVMEHFARRMRRSGYEIFPKLLDALWYGVPQYRSRFFVLGLRTDLGYSKADFGDWGPFPRPSHGPACDRPYVTVRDAILDLPRIKNGDDIAEREYEEPSADQLRANPFLKSMRRAARRGVILDHVTSRHSEYVLDRYRNIPEGGNWRDILKKLTNYADARRTHSNIYRRLAWREPAITIGHYRKSMLVHPNQHRGLSLREAARLQSFPDWFRFSGGLVHKQQQLANAVCPLVTKALAEFILRL